ncbi:MAG TPA: hypothetical protein VHE35_37000 [Kofleriaceae bacterium]|nr:hypothetical protein [Kofleriaceae bacterium]
MAVSFGRWYPLADAAAHAPAAPGVLQLRLADGLLDYPRGKSAMLHYAAASDLRAAATELAAAHPGTGWLCRHTDGPVGDPAALAADLLRTFTARFGAPPTFPAAPPAATS